jgi:hypothetical protein
LLVAVADNPRDELRAALGARQELGPDLEPEIIKSFLDRLVRETRCGRLLNRWIRSYLMVGAES